MRTDVRGNCLASLTAFEAEKHQGIWQCGLSSDDIDDISKMNLTIMTHVQARIEMDPQSAISVPVNDTLDITCQTINLINHQNDPVLHWSLTDPTTQILTKNDTWLNCQDKQCLFVSDLTIKAIKSVEISCHAEQKDSWESVIRGADKTVSVEVISNENEGGLSKTAKITLGVLIPLLIIGIVGIILAAFLLGCCCFANR